MGLSPAAASALIIFCVVGGPVVISLIELWNRRDDRR